MRKHKSTKSIISITLIITLLISVLIPSDMAFAEKSSNQIFYDIPDNVETITDDVSFTVPDNEPKELTKFRTAKSKRFLNRDGSLTEKIYSHPVNYKDKKTGKWEPIKSNLKTETQDTFKNMANDFNISLHKKANGFVKYSEEGSTFSFRPLFASPVKGVVKDNFMTFEDVTTDTDMIYAITPYGLKETLILKSKEAPAIFTYEIKLKDLEYQIKEDGSVIFTKPGNTEPIFTLDKPFLLDANLEMSTNASYEFRNKGKKLYLDLVGDAEWLQAPERVYPVEFDPTINTNDENSLVTDTLISSNNPTTNYDFWAHFYVGQGTTLGTARSLLWFNLPSLPSGAVIDSANLDLLNTQVYATSQTPVMEVHRVTTNWAANSVNWNSRPSVGGIDGTVTISNSTAPYNISVPITGLVEEWYNGTQDNYGIQLQFANENLATREFLASNDPYDPSNHPSLTINYTIDGLGQQSFWTFDSSVNMANGNIVLEETDILFPGRGIDVSLGRVYNSRSSVSGVFGYGWISAMDMHLVIPTKGPAKLTESNGTTHYFTQNVDGSYNSPPGMFWTLSGDQTTAIITTTDQIEYTFSGGKIEKLTNAAGNTLTFVYTSGQITGIKDNADNTITLSYINGRIDTATDPANRIWDYDYDVNGNLTKVTTPNGKIVQYRYDDNHNLIAIVSPKGETDYIVYSSDDRVVSINPINAITNGNFEVDANGNGIPDHFYIYTGETGQEILDTNSGSEYGTAFKINTSSANTYFYTVYLSDPVPVDTSKTYTLSGYLKGEQISGTLTTVLSLIAYDSNDVSLGEIDRIAPTGSFDWSRYEISEALPVGTVKVRVKVGASVSSGSGSSWWDGIQLEEGDKASELATGTQFTSNPSTSQSAAYDGDGRKRLYTYTEDQNVDIIQQDPLGLNLTDDFAWHQNVRNAIQSHQDPKGHLWQYDYDPLTGNLIKIIDSKDGEQILQWNNDSNLTQYTGVNQENYTMTYDDKKNNMTTVDPFNTNSSSVQKFDQYNNLIENTAPISIADNLIDNSSFEGNKVAGMPEYFSYQNGEQNTWSVVPALDHPYGNNAFKLTASSSNPSFYTVVVSDSITIDAGMNYMLSGFLKNIQSSGTQTGVLSVYAYDNLDGYLGEVGRINLQGHIDDWQRWSTTINKADFPASTTKIRVKLAVSNTTGSGETYFDAIQVQKNAIDTKYNLVDNSNLERGSSWPTGWTQANSGVNNWESIKVYAEDKAVSISNASTWSGISTVDYIPYKNDKKYNLTAFIKTENLSADVAHIKIEFYDEYKVLIEQVSSDKLGENQDWQRVSIDILENAGPLETKYIRPVLATGNATGTVYFDNIRLQEGNYISKYGYNQPSNTWLETITDPLGNLSTNNYDSAGNVTSMTDPMGNNVVFDYYSNSNKIKWIKPAGNELKIIYDYDDNGNIESIKNTNPDQTVTYNETTYGYNEKGLISSSTDPLAQQTLYSYSPAGKLTKLNNPENQITYSYDKVQRMTDVYFNGVLNYHYNYDKNGNMESIIDSTINNRKWTATHDLFDQLSSWDDEKGKINYQRNNVGNITQNKLTVGVVTKTQDIAYDIIQQPETLTDADGNVSKFLFNESGQVSTIQSGNGINQRIDYDDIGRAAHIQNKTSTGQILSSYKYDYRADSFVDKIIDQNNFEISYTYTVNGELETELLPSGNTVTYTYDPRGNMKTRVEKQPDETIVNTTTFDYDVANQLIKINDLSVTNYDGNGNMTSDGTNDYTWDAGNRLVQVNKVSDGSLIANYQYDNRGRRVYENVGGDESYFLYDGYSNRVLAEIDELGALKKYYTWSPLGHLLSLTVDGVTYYTITNGHGDIIQLTDENADIVASYSYDAWGNIISETGSAASLNPYRYAGYRYDEVTGLYYLNARYYSPSLYRFISRDPFINNNLYMYSLNNPVNLTDPNGTNAFQIITDFFANVKEGFVSAAPAYQTAGAVAFLDGPVPIGDVIAGIGATVITLGVIGVAGFETIDDYNEKSESIPIAIDEALAKKKKMTPIYRWGSDTYRNLTPRITDFDGLSFSLVYPVNKKHIVTYMEAVNATGVLQAIKNKPKHVSVIPTVISELEEWSKTRETANISPHPYSRLMKALVTRGR